VEDSLSFHIPQATPSGRRELEVRWLIWHRRPGGVEHGEIASNHIRIVVRSSATIVGSGQSLHAGLDLPSVAVRAAEHT